MVVAVAAPIIGAVRAAAVVQRTSVPAPLLVFAAAASVQVGAAFAKSLFDEVGPPAVVFLRLVFGGIAVWLLARPRVRGRSRRDLGLVLALGIVLAVMNTTFYAALDRIPLGVAVTVEFIGPLAVAVASSRRALDLLWIAFAAAGIVLLADPSGDLDPVGIALAAAAGVGWGVYIVLGVRVGRAWAGSSGLAVSMAVGAALTAPLGVAAGGAERQQAVRERPGLFPARGVDDEPGRLVHDEEVLVLVDDVEGDRLGDELLRLGQRDVEPFSALEPEALRPALAVDEDVAGADEALGRRSGADTGQRGDDGIEAPPRVGVRNARAVKCQRRRSCGRPRRTTGTAARRRRR